jgi:hypothetical protein
VTTGGNQMSQYCGYKNNRQIVNNNNCTEITFYQAMQFYKLGKTIECRILNKSGEIIEWEKYNKCEGLDIALEFREILYGQWFVVSEKYYSSINWY